MVMLVMTIRWSSAQLKKKKEKNKILWRSRQRYKYDVGFGDQDILEGVITYRIDSCTIKREILWLSSLSSATRWYCLLLTVDMTQIYTFKTPSTGSIWKEHRHIISIFYPITSSTCPWNIGCIPRGNRDKWVNGTHLVGSPDPLWGSPASHTGHDPRETL